MDNGFFFAGQHSSEYHLVVEKYPVQLTPERRRTSVAIPGRNGALHLDEGAYKNVRVFYECYFTAPRPTPEQAHRIKSWLLSAPAGSRLEDAYDPDYFRLAVYSGPADIENILNRYGRMKITFDCDPRAFLKSGTIPRTLTAPGSVHNPTAFDAQPLITVTGTGAGTLTVGGITVEILELDGSIILDCELMDAYWGEENKNAAIYAPEFPVLAAGKNEIVFDGGITSVEIVPRWWTL